MPFMNLTMLVLNTNLYYDSNSLTEEMPDPANQLQWFFDKLQEAQDQGTKVRMRRGWGYWGIWRREEIKERNIDGRKEEMEERKTHGEEEEREERKRWGEEEMEERNIDGGKEDTEKRKRGRRGRDGGEK